MPSHEYRHAGLAMLVARRWWIDGLELADLHQEAMLSMIEAEPRYDRSKARESTFFHRVATNHLRSLLRATEAKKRVPPALVSSLDLELAGGDSTIDFLEAPDADPALIVERRDTIRRALAEPTLSRGERACLVADAVGAEPSELGYSATLGYLARVKIRAAA